jgi:hypothetical protein
MLLSRHKLAAWIMRQRAAMAKGWAMRGVVLGCWQHTETSLWATCREAAAAAATAVQATLKTMENCKNLGV